MAGGCSLSGSRKFRKRLSPHFVHDRGAVIFHCALADTQIEDEVVRILGRGIKSDKLVGWDSGAVGLVEIKIHIPERLEEPVECDSLVAQVQKAFASFTEQDVEAIDGITSNRGEA